MGLFSYSFGHSAEIDVANWCQNELDWIIQCMNFKCRFGEIDIVAKDRQGILHFIEVKATSRNYEAEYRLTALKFNKILKTVNFFIGMNKYDGEYQIDLAVVSNGKFKLIENISI